MNAPSSWVKLTRLRLRGFGAIFGKFFSGKIGLHSQSRRAAYAIVGHTGLLFFAKRVENLFLWFSFLLGL